MEKLETATLYITVHLGAGVGKAITGVAKPGDSIILLEKPENDYYVNKLDSSIEVLIMPSAGVIREKVACADVVVINWWGHPLMIRFLTCFPSVPCRLIIWSHVNGCVYPYLPYSFLNIFERIVFTSAYSYHNPLWTVKEREEISQKSTVVYGMGESPEHVKPKSNYDIGDKFVVGYVGTLNYAKLSPKFVTYCEAVADIIPNSQFVLVGSLDNAVQRDILKSRISDKFEIIGYTNEVERYYRSFDVFAYLLNDYNYATTENVLLEAMAYGLPIVVLNNGVEREIIQEGLNGYLVTTPEEYAERLLSLKSSFDIRKTIGEQARKHVCREYVLDNNQNKLYSIIVSCYKEKKKTYSFRTLLGNSLYEAFLYLSGKEGRELEQFLLKQIDGIDKIRHIFFQETKGSVFQFEKYASDDIKIKELADFLRAYYVIECPVK